MSDSENQGQQPPQGSDKRPRGLNQLGLFNFVLTVGLLVFGIISIFQNLNDYLHPADIVNEALANMHVQNSKFPEVTYDRPRVSAAAGSFLLTIQGANFGLITWWAVTRLRAGKVSFWVPMVGAAIASILSFITIVLMITSDQPIMAAFIDFVKASAN